MTDNERDLFTLLEWLASSKTPPVHLVPVFARLRQQLEQKTALPRSDEVLMR
jgi:hypothetical protein